MPGRIVSPSWWRRLSHRRRRTSQGRDRAGLRPGRTCVAARQRVAACWRAPLCRESLFVNGARAGMATRGRVGGAGSHPRSLETRSGLGLPRTVARCRPRSDQSSFQTAAAMAVGVRPGSSQPCRRSMRIRRGLSDLQHVHPCVPHPFSQCTTSLPEAGDSEIVGSRPTSCGLPSGRTSPIGTGSGRRIFLLSPGRRCRSPTCPFQRGERGRTSHTRTR